MVNYNPENHGYDAGKIGYSELDKSAISALGETISLESLMNNTEEAAEIEEAFFGRRILQDRTKQLPGVPGAFDRTAEVDWLSGQDQEIHEKDPPGSHDRP